MDLITASKHGDLNRIRSMLQQQQGVMGRYSTTTTPPPRHPQEMHLGEGANSHNPNQRKKSSGNERSSNSSHHDHKKQNDQILYEALFAASQYGYLNVVKCLVEQGNANLFHKEDLNTPLHIACAMGRKDVAMYLAAATTTRMAAEEGTLPQQRRCDVTAISSGGPDVVMRSSSSSSSSALEHLDREGNPPHISACCNGNVEIVRHLMETYPQIIHVNQGYGAQCLAPIHWAARVNSAELAWFLLVERQAQVNLKAKGGQTALHFACRRRLLNPSAPILPVVDVLLQHGADLYAINEAGNTPLLEALQWNQTDVVRRLLDYQRYFSSNSTMTTNTGTTSSSNHHRALDHVNQQGHNALSLACSQRNLEMVQLLLGQGASVCNAPGWQALTTACQANQADLVRLLVEARFGQQHPPTATMIPLGRRRGGGPSAMATTTSDDSRGKRQRTSSSLDTGVGG